SRVRDRVRAAPRAAAPRTRTGCLADNGRRWRDETVSAGAWFQPGLRLARNAGGCARRPVERRWRTYARAACAQRRNARLRRARRSARARALPQGAAGAAKHSSPAGRAPTTRAAPRPLRRRIRWLALRLARPDPPLTSRWARGRSATRGPRSWRA